MQTRILQHVTAAICAIFFFASTAVHADETTTVKAGSLELKVPKTWQEEKPKSSLRLTQFKIPAVGDDKEDAELAVFSFRTSDVRANINRWIGQFEAKDRKVQISHGEAGMEIKYIFVDIGGTYNKPVGPPIQGKTEPTPNSRVLGVILVVKKDDKGEMYFLKMAGPDKTVAAQATALRTAIGGKAEDEEKIDLEE